MPLPFVSLNSRCDFVFLGGEDNKRANRQLKDAEFGNKDIGNLQELMDVLPNIDVSDVMEIPKVFRCDEQTLPCDHTTKYRTLTGWCNNLNFPEYGKSIVFFLKKIYSYIHPRTSSTRGQGTLIFICRRSRADLEVSFGVLVVDVVDVVLEPLPLLSE